MFRYTVVISGLFRRQPVMGGCVPLFDDAVTDARRQAQAAADLEPVGVEGVLPAEEKQWTTTIVIEHIPPKKD